jgi:hypothetical protein
MLRFLNFASSGDEFTRKLAKSQENRIVDVNEKIELKMNQISGSCVLSKDDSYLCFPNILLLID